MKTIRQWLEELPDPYRSEALDLYDKSDLPFKTKEVESKHRALLLGFQWNKYEWIDLYEKLKANNE